MIYPSHWSPGDFGLEAPDTEPYKTVDRYLDKEKALKGIDRKKLNLVHGFKTLQHLI